jgi:hypothetical protein
MGDSPHDLESDVSSALVDALARDGRRLEVIRLLTETNRVDRHPQIGEHLVALRNEAVPLLSKPTGPRPEEVVPTPAQAHELSQGQIPIAC